METFTVTPEMMKYARERAEHFVDSAMPNHRDKWERVGSGFLCEAAFKLWQPKATYVDERSFDFYLRGVKIDVKGKVTKSKFWRKLNSLNFMVTDDATHRTRFKMDGLYVFAFIDEDISEGSIIKILGWKTFEDFHKTSRLIPRGTEWDLRDDNYNIPVSAMNDTRSFNAGLATAMQSLTSNP